MVQWFELRKRNTDFTFEFTKSHKSILRLKEPLKNTEEENYPNCIFRVDSGEWHSISYQRGKTLARHRDILVNGESAPCPFCRLCEETASHLLLTCFVEDRIWKWC